MSEHYHSVSKFIHWLTALLILGLLAVGFYMVSIEFSESKLQLYSLHKSFGLVVLVLIVLRIVWHRMRTKPKPLDTHQAWEKVLAHAAHILLYVLMIVMPLSGWVMSSAGDFTVSFFGVYVPDIVEKNEELFKISRFVHEVSSFLLVLIVCLHIAGALKHHFIDNDMTLRRMTSLSFGLLSGVVLVLALATIFIPIGFYGMQYVEKKYLKNDTAKVAVEVVFEDTGAEVVSDVQAWDVNLENSKVEFEAMQYGQGFKGEFKIARADIFFDEQRLDETNIYVEVDIGSISTGSEDRDTQARSEEWFNVPEYPYAIFQADFVERNEEGYVATGMLKIRDVNLPLELPFTLNIEEGQAVMNSLLSLNRLDFGVGQGQWESTDAIGGDVNLSITVRATAK